MELLNHQKEAFAIASKFDSYGLFMETGTGKTLVAIELIKMLRARWELKRKSLPIDPGAFKTLVVCPLQCINGVWKEEIAKFAPGLRFQNLWEVASGKRIPAADVYAINYESVYRLPPEVLGNMHYLILDESSKIKNIKAKVTKFLLRLSKDFRYKLVMSGTPAPNTPLEYWSQMFFVNPEVLGSNYYAYRAKNFWSYGFGGYQWKPRKEFVESLPKTLSKQSYAVQKENCLDLPEQTFSVRKCIMDAEQKKAYVHMLRENILQLKDKFVLGVNELAQIMKLRQITSGFVISEDHSEMQISNTKLDVLKETLEEIGNNQVIIWANFKWEIRKIQEALGDNAVSYYGETNSADRQSAIDRFRSGEVKYFIGNPKSCGHGLTFTNCAYVVYYSLDYSYESEKQSRDRVHRIGQSKNVSYIYLLCDGTIDEIIYKALRNKENLSDSILEMVKGVAC